MVTASVNYVTLDSLSCTSLMLCNRCQPKGTCFRRNLLL